MSTPTIKPDGDVKTALEQMAEVVENRNVHEWEAIADILRVHFSARYIAGREDEVSRRRDENEWHKNQFWRADEPSKTKNT